MTVTQTTTQRDPRIAIKRIARRLFAERGLRDVTLREIAAAAGQRNLGVVSYYFGTKENLVVEILIDGAKKIEALRQAHLDRLNAAGGPSNVLQVIEALVLPSAQFADEDDQDGAYFNRFLLQLSLGSEGLIDRTLEGRWNDGYQRCLRYLRRLMPNLSPTEKNRRFVFLGSYVGALLALRESMLADQSRAHPMWRSETTLEDIVRTAAAVLEAPLPHEHGNGSHTAKE